MQISSRFTIAVHALICMEVFKDQYKVTSELLASSVNANPVVVRRLLQQLKKAGLVRVRRGSGGAEIAKPLEEITLLDVYNAVECVETGQLFHFHENPNQKCPVGRNIHAILDQCFGQCAGHIGQTAGFCKRIRLRGCIQDSHRILLP